MKKILWFSRHTMTAEQRDALPPCEITQINGTMRNVHVPFEAVVICEGGDTRLIKEGEDNSTVKYTFGDSVSMVKVQPFKEIMKGYDIIAIVAPIAIQHQILVAAESNQPVIMAKSKRIIESVDGTENKVTFVFDGWERLIKIDVVTEPFVYE